MRLDRIVPWGRSFAEYQAMFSLTQQDLDARILGCGDGPASFNAELTERGGRVVSVDPVYQFSAQQLQQRIDEVYPRIMTQMAANRENYNWQKLRSPQELGEVRMAAMRRFLQDYDQGCSEGRYLQGGLPDLPFVDQTFDLALSSHFLFLYSDFLDFDQHLQGIREMARVAREVRIYPLLALDGRESEYLAEILEQLPLLGFFARLETVSYRFQKGATQMLVVTPR
ncbi:class I SAM-dependent methyltransferase [Marinospirillum perlucidum]|uniref:class I SAM-dependent methyltransferase n=1 Tax=Marinospirillum perlucidum TaxID=1982602 RepID=UPI000DF457F5|nr:class I SAM-dependent methyltransferase [Marinospirillum perlucidum]